jgi:TPR repeat protein
MNHPVAWYRFAELFAYGTGGVDADFAKARTYARRTCAAHSGEGCYLLGRMNEVGLGGRRDQGKASELYRQACAYGVKADCSRPLTPRTEIDWWRALP